MFTDHGILSYTTVGGLCSPVHKGASLTNWVLDTIDLAYTVVAYQGPLLPQPSCRLGLRHRSKARQFIQVPYDEHPCELYVVVSEAESGVPGLTAFVMLSTRWESRDGLGI